MLTKKSAEELAYYLEEQQIKVCYLHHALKTPQRTEILHKLRSGIFECVVGVNLLREGLDLPEVALVAIMDADVEGFLRDKRSIIQTVGRAARNTEAQVLLYADKMTKSMQSVIEETDRRCAIQIAYNEEHNITPKTVQRKVTKSISKMQEAIAEASKSKSKKQKKQNKVSSDAPETADDIQKQLAVVEKEMQQAAQDMDFEHAIQLREEWKRLKSLSKTKS